MVCKLALLSHASEAIAAVNRTIGLGLKGNLSLAAAGSASSGEELTGATGSSLASIAAGLAALGLILETTLGIELLLAGGKNEFFTAFFADKCLVFVHVFLPHSIVFRMFHIHS